MTKFLEGTSQELLDTVNELVETKTKLNKLKVKNRLKTNTKIYKKLSDIEVILSRMECHSNEQLKLNRFMAKMLFQIFHLSGNHRYNDHEKVADKNWKEFCRIAD